MKSQIRLNLMCRGVVVLTVLLAGSAQAASLGAIAEERLEPSQLVLEPLFGFERAALTVEGPAGYVLQRAFDPGETVRLALFDGEGGALQDGRYRYLLRLTPGPASSSDVQKGLFFVNGGSGVSRTERRDQLASIRETLNREVERRIQARQQTAAIPYLYALTIDGDFALGGYLFKEGKPFLHNYGGFTYGNTALGLNALVHATPGSPYSYNGSENTAVGQGALQYNTTGYYNTASGYHALLSNTTGSYNTASGANALLFNTTVCCNTATGDQALLYNTTGYVNTASGTVALRNNTTGDGNTASGNGALNANTTGSRNTASGNAALVLNTTGNRNTAAGYRAGLFATTGSDNVFLGSGAYGVAGEANTIRIGGTTVGTLAGRQNRTFINGIRGVTVANDVPVLIDGNTGQLGTVSSSRRYKKEIEDMAEASEKLLDLRPVTFKYKQEPVEGEQPLQFGLIAEEVAEVLPDLVVYDDEGQPYAVRYHLLNSMLLNELQKQQRLSQEQGEQLRLLRERMARLEALEARDVLLAEGPTRPN